MLPPRLICRLVPAPLAVVILVAFIVLSRSWPDQSRYHVVVRWFGDLRYDRAERMDRLHVEVKSLRAINGVLAAVGRGMSASACDRASPHCRVSAEALCAAFHKPLPRKRSCRGQRQAVARLGSTTRWITADEAAGAGVIASSERIDIWALMPPRLCTGVPAGRSMKIRPCWRTDG
jgi:hypothetical protein